MLNQFTPTKVRVHQITCPICNFQVRFRSKGTSFEIYAAEAGGANPEPTSGRATVQDSASPARNGSCELESAVADEVRSCCFPDWTYPLKGLNFEKAATQGRFSKVHLIRNPHFVTTKNRLLAKGA